MSFVAVSVHGLDELVRSLGRAQVRIRPALRSELRTLATSVAEEAKSRARSQGLVRSGALVKDIRPSVRGTSALIRESAVRRQGKNAPFGYPALYEFGGRPFMYPAADGKRGEIERGLENAVERVLDGAGL